METNKGEGTVRKRRREAEAECCQGSEQQISLNTLRVPYLTISAVLELARFLLHSFREGTISFGAPKLKGEVSNHKLV